MFKNYLKVAIRNLLKNKVYVLINMLGMGTAIACCIVAYLNFKFYHDYDVHNERVNDIYRLNYVETNADRMVHSAMVPFPLETSLKSINGIDQVTRYARKGGTIRHQNNLFSTRIGFVDDAYLEMFTVPINYGTSMSMSDKEKILISDELSVRLFNEKNSIGRSVRFVDNGKEKEWIIGGVFEAMPLNSSTQFEVLMNFESYFEFYKKSPSSWQNATTFFFTFQGDHIPQNIDENINKLTKIHQEVAQELAIIQYYKDPLKGMAARASEVSVLGPFGEIVPWPLVAVVAFISLLILMIACFTFTNTSIAASANRVKEIGIRKVMGGHKSHIIRQFLIENVMMCLLSLIIAIPLSKFLADEFSQLFPITVVELTYSDHASFALFLFGLLVIVGIIAGAYPALYLSKFQPAKILKGDFVFGHVSRFSKSLLYIQLCFSMIAIVSSVFFIQNVSFQNSIDLGFDTDETIVIRFTEGNEGYKAFSEKLKENPKVSALTGGSDHVGRRNYYNEVNAEGRKLKVAGMDVGADYLFTMELTTINGRDFNETLQSDFNNSVIINEQFVKTMNWSEPLGKRVTFGDTLSCKVIGVVKDFYYDAFNSEILPMTMRMVKPDEYRYVIAKTRNLDIDQLKEEIILLWTELFPEDQYDIKTGAHARFESEFINLMILKVFIFMGVIATILSLIGLFALVAMHLTNRTKEIGIRKILGASPKLILLSINKSYLLIILISLITGALISYFLTPLLMDAIWAYHIKENPIVILITILCMLCFALLVIGFKVRSALSTNPIQLLRND